MMEVNTHEAKTRLSALLYSVETKHETVVICRGGRPVAQLGPIEYKDPLKQHAAIKKGVVVGDVTGPLDPADWPEQFR